MRKNRLRAWWEQYWLQATIGAVMVVAFLVPLWFLMDMDTERRDYILGSNLVGLPFGILNTLVFVGMLWMMDRTGTFSKIKKSRIEPLTVGVRFSDVIGLTEAKREAGEVVHLLKDRAAVRRVGGKILKGVLMIGPPGCGKTLLAKAIAAEAGLPFLSVSGSEFVEMYVGVGAGRVRALFKEARRHAENEGGCLVFIDELEVVGRQRVYNNMESGGMEERNSTLNQLLVEMDGLSGEDSNVVVIGATNAGEDVLDSALMRPGRFDRKLHVNRPNLDERTAIFRHYLDKVRVDLRVDVPRLARKAVGKTPAEIENVVKEAALIAVRRGTETIGPKELSEAVERIDLGVAHKLNMTAGERTRTAIHEAGHLVAIYLTHPTNDVFKASIIQRGGALGVVHSVPREELHSADRMMLLANIRVALAGHAAEQIKYGYASDGVRSDFAAAMHYAHDMVWRYGMSLSAGLIGDFSAMPKSELSEALKERLNAETLKILHAIGKETEDLLKKEWELVERFARELEAREELDFDDIDAIFNEYGRKRLTRTN